MVSPYTRPVIPDREYFNEFGQQVLYGRRRATSPEADLRPEPDELQHPERYAPIFEVADALIDYLVASYDIAISEDPQSPGLEVMSLPPASLFARVVHLKPSAADQAPLMIGFHDFPNDPGHLTVVAGSFSYFDMWFCGCGLCDEPWEDIADDLEHVVLSLAERGLTERLDPGRWGYARYWLDLSAPEEWMGRSPKRQLGRTPLASARKLARILPDGRWRPWTPRNPDPAEPSAG